MLECGEGTVEKKSRCVPFGFREKMGDGLASAPVAEEFGHLGDTFATCERGETKDGTPKMRKVATTNLFADAFEKSLAKAGKTVYTDHRTSRKGSIFHAAFFSPNES